jgi:hypothetical protein
VGIVKLRAPDEPVRPLSVPAAPKLVASAAPCDGPIANGWVDEMPLAWKV